MTRVRIADLSSYQGRIDGVQVRGAGFSAAWVKVSEVGSGFRYYNPYAAAVWKSCKAAGLAVGGYLYFHAAYDPAEQVSYYYERLKANGTPLESVDLVPMVDAESGGLDGMRGAAAADRLAQVLEAFLKAGERTVLLYMGGPTWEQMGEPRGKFWAQFPLMLPFYLPEPAKPPEDSMPPGFGSWSRPTVWQYTDAAQAGGQAVDASVLTAGTLDSLRRIKAPLPVAKPRTLGQKIAASLIRGGFGGKSAAEVVAAAERGGVKVNRVP